MLLRGAVLRKTTWVVGLVVYTGMQTKLKMNDEEVRPKRTQVESLMNTMIGHLLKVQVAMVCVFGAFTIVGSCLLYTSPSPRDRTRSRMPSSA